MSRLKVIKNRNDKKPLTNEKQEIDKINNKIQQFNCRKIEKLHP